MASQSKELPASEVSVSAVDSFNTRTGAVTAEAEDYSAAQIVNTPAGTITEENVQDALNELDTLKQAKAFTVDEATDWDVEPTTIEEAINQLAARLRAIE